MYPFRLSTWHSLAVYVVLLSMIAPATFALPIESDTTAPQKVGPRIAARAHQAEPSRTNSIESRGSGPNEAKLYHVSVANLTPKELIVTVIIKDGMEKVTQNGQEKWVPKGKLDPNADWVVAFIPPEVEDPSQSDREVEVWGYQTTKDEDTAPKGSVLKQWKRTVGQSTQRSLYGAHTTLTSADRVVKIAAVKISGNTQVYLKEHITEQVTNSRSDKLPNVLSIYEVLLLNRKFLRNFSFDISKSSEFGKAFDEMVREKGTGAGRVLSKVRDEWEWELYERIKDGAIALDDNLLDRKNEDILEKLWGEVHPLSRYVNDQEDWDEQRRERLALGGSLQSPGQN
ncbi:hypothetical protein FB446DRAFT_111250 [Lentinula raphanica]|nr:hypothetical protein FB446DRAFT_111250 [Lentinula raphanica]